MDDLRFTLPYPPSANRYWRHFRGIMVTSDAARLYKSDARLTLAQKHIEPFHGAVVVSVDVFRPTKRGDLDNCLKVLLDSLNGVAYDDDAQIVELHARRFDDKKRPRVEIVVRPFNVP